MNTEDDEAFAEAVRKAVTEDLCELRVRLASGIDKLCAQQRKVNIELQRRGVRANGER